jgi:hypothetical protein
MGGIELISEMPLLMVLVQSVIRSLPNSLCPMGRILHRTHGYKRSLLKVRRRKYKGKHGVSQVEFGGQESMPFSFSGTLKTYINPWEGNNQVIFIQ